MITPPSVLTKLGGLEAIAMVNKTVATDIGTRMANTLDTLEQEVLSAEARKAKGESAFQAFKAADNALKDLRSVSPESWEAALTDDTFSGLPAALVVLQNVRDETNVASTANKAAGDDAAKRMQLATESGWLPAELSERAADLIKRWEEASPKRTSPSAKVGTPMVTTEGRRYSVVVRDGDTVVKTYTSTPDRVRVSSYADSLQDDDKAALIAAVRQVCDSHDGPITAGNTDFTVSRSFEG